METTNSTNPTTKKYWNFNFNFSGILSSTFKYWWKSLSTSVIGWLVFSLGGGIIILLLLGLLGFFFYELGLFTVDLQFNYSMLNRETWIYEVLERFVNDNPLGTSIYLLIATFLLVIVISMLNAYIYGALKVSSERGTLPQPNDGWVRFGKYFGRFFIFQLLLTLLFILIAIPSVLLLFIPLIILGVYWSLGVFYYTFDRMSFWESLKKSYNTIKGNWWTVFGLYFVFGAIIGISSLILRLIPLLGGILSGILRLSIFYLYFIVFYTLTNSENNTQSNNQIEIN